MTLLILAAGIGSRYGGLKQMEPFGPNKEFIIDYSVYDAIKAGFDKVVFVIKRELLEDFKNTIGNRLVGKIKVEYAFQDVYDIPNSNKIEREKPWGTGHAILAARNIIKENFLMINADDFYGRDAFIQAYNFLKEEVNDNTFGLIGYKVVNTLSENGAVKRGLCEINDSYVVGITECSVYESDDKLKWKTLKDGKEFETDKDKYVSMSMLLFTPKIFDFLEKDFELFLKNIKNPLTDEFLIHDMIDKHIKQNKLKVKLLKTKSKWYGVTYKEDKEKVASSINKMIDINEYPKKLW